MGLDLVRLRRTVAQLLRAPEVAPARTAGGWVPIDVLADVATSRAGMRISAADVRASLDRGGEDRLEMDSERVRIAGRRPAEPVAAPSQDEGGRGREREVPSEADSSGGGGSSLRRKPDSEVMGMRGRRGEVRAVRRPSVPSGPDIVYHATTASQVQRVRDAGALVQGEAGPVHLSRVEAHAWRVAHRYWDDPVVLYIDAARARRDGVRIERTRSGHFAAERLPVRYVLNMREGFAEQTSAGGFLVDWSSGRARIALIRVHRRGGGTWEVAKGKLEPGERPDMAAAREVQEEMGIACELRVTGAIGTVRYGFSTPDGSPRLKTIYLYLLEPEEPTCAFTPARGEGIDEVRWFEVADAVDALAHPSLRGAIGRLLEALGERAAELGHAAPRVG